MKVRDVMTASPVTVPPDLSVPEAAAVMKAGGFHHLPVVKDRKLIGMLTDRDLKEALPSDVGALTIFEVSYLLERLNVERIMTEPVTIRPGRDVREAACKMLDLQIDGLTVLDPRERLVGILTVTDLLRTFVGRTSILMAAQKPFQSRSGRA
ncbi:CBS domain-containing protein [Deinococcus roseus]|uniref:CBS domain-containing protein n=1 Tax=Deinococcus roseus TaxID=392414 RepID=A0ABQ2CWQ4_9DEIO|nr:CBS domain-containing protein [Deinococcus roseus]GGJ28493.1 hypothetical protein GCM10008938_13190 [Deinococcus roseus]